MAIFPAAATHRAADAGRTAAFAKRSNSRATHPEPNGWAKQITASCSLYIHKVRMTILLVGQTRTGISPLSPEGPGEPRLFLSPSPEAPG